MPTSERILRAIVDERRRALSRSLHGAPRVSHHVVKLREQMHAYRRQAIALNAKLAVLESERGEVRQLREQLVDTTSKLDSAVATLVDDIASAAKA